LPICRLCVNELPKFLQVLDGAMIVRIVLGRHEEAFKPGSYGYKLSWPAPSFDVDQLLSVVSPLQLTSFYPSMATGPRTTVLD
jgi:hypothetical protein